MVHLLMYKFFWISESFRRCSEKKEAVSVLFYHMRLQTVKKRGPFPTWRYDAPKLAYWRTDAAITGAGGRGRLWYNEKASVSSETRK
ncbi:hypothetical protein GTCCBUS3UF5_20520 [Geobacillus thermoleovorans CCB_US3_UF5]|uniref:Uncharacterized protein n=1 Tax=Geobacillus thermoleovorans CCB_US3_UF5 TaxID=1111068 RepID=A0ABM5MI26_GEOTH|nr:hypothetical protein GTCCBUS3UF5_20520 [Geobacillus thermoleovorans CCB_US3_UF5]